MSYNPYSLAGKTILVTGAGSGIGRATSVECSKLGARLVLVDINEQGNANNINVGNSNLGMSSTVTAPNNNEALEGENEALLAGFNS